MNGCFRGFLTIVLIALMSLISTGVNAAVCKLSTSEALVNITDDITLNPAEKGSAGTVLWSKSYNVPNIKYSCNSGVQSTWHSEYSRSYISASLENVYATEIPGIGIRIKWPSSGSGVWVPGSSGNPISCTTECSVTNSTILIEFVQTGSLSQGDSYIPAGEIAKASVIPTTDTGNPLRIMTVNFGTAIKVVTRSCSIVPSTTSLDLGSYNLSYFANSSTTQGDKKEFMLTINCPVQERISLTLTSLASLPFGSGTGVIGVESGDGYAKNFAIKIYEKKSTYVSTAVSIGKASEFNVLNTVAKTYQAQIYIPSGIDRKTSLSAGSIVGAIQYTMVIL